MNTENESPSRNPHADQQPAAEPPTDGCDDVSRRTSSPGPFGGGRGLVESPDRDQKGGAGGVERAELKHYVAGFMFDHGRTRVALIRKAKPAWQRGKLNGIGGKVEAGENVFEAMVREFMEETGYETTVAQWEQFLRMAGENDDGGNFRVDFFATIGDLTRVRTMEAEPVEIVFLTDVHAVRKDMIENLPWLIPLALDYLDDERPHFVDAHYASGRAGGGGGVWGNDLRYNLERPAPNGETSDSFGGRA